LALRARLGFLARLRLGGAALLGLLLGFLPRFRLAPAELLRLPAVLLLELAQLLGVARRGPCARVARPVGAARGAAASGTGRRSASGPRDRAALAQLGDLALGELRVRAVRELLQVE